MEDDSEVLDWGHEEEDITTHSSGQRSFAVDDPEDAVSLGGDEEDEFLTYQSRVPQDTHRAHSPPKSARQARQEPIKGRSDSPRPPHPQDERTGHGDQSALPSRTHPFVHALPPKPVVSNVSFVHHSHPSIIEATAMASRADREKRNGTGSKPSVHDHNDSLPSGWEVKYPRNGRGVYYYNIHTHESTWTRPTSPGARERRSERSDHHDDLDRPLSAKNETLTPRVGRSEGGDMPHGDRYYRPGGTGRREERPAPSAQLIDSYVPDAYSPDHRDSRPSPPPSRPRERDPTPPPRRPLSSADSYGDRDGMQTSHREAPSLAPLSTQDRVWVARDDVPHERPRERRQHDDPPSETERRNPPRDTERSSTTRPKSPASYTRRSQESATATPHSSNKPAQSLSDASLARKSRFSQADSPPQYRQPESRETGIRRARTDDVASHSARYIDNGLNSRSMSDVRGDNDTSIHHPTSDAQRSGPRKRSALPPQDEAFRPGTRPPPAQPDSYPPASAGPVPTPVSQNRRRRVTPDDMPHDSGRRSASPPPPQFDPPTEWEERDRGNSRWTKPHANGPSHADSHTLHESSRGRAHDFAMDVDTPLPRSSDPPTKQFVPRRPPMQDEVPRYPRAMLNSDGDGPPRGVRETRDGIESKHRFATDDSSRFGPPRDRQGVDRQSTHQNMTQREPIRGAETRPPPAGSTVKLSGTNNIPIGARNKLPSNILSANMPPSATHRASIVTSGSNDEPVVPRRDQVNRNHERLPHLDGTTGDRDVQMQPPRHENTRPSPVIIPRAVPQTELPPPPPARPSRAALGLSRFGPPIVKENTEPVALPPQKSASLESLALEKIAEGSTHATPPPPSRESSMTSFNDVALPSVRPSHLPARPASPSRGNRYRSGSTNKPYSRPNVRSPGAQDTRNRGLNIEVPTRTKPPSLLTRNHAVDPHPSNPSPTSRSERDATSPVHSQTNLRAQDPEVDHHVTRPSAPPPVQDEGRDRAPPPMHPERALMLQANGLPPRPLSTLGRARPAKGFKRDKRDDHEHDRAEPLRGNHGGRFRSASPGKERRHYPEEDHVMGYGGGSGAGGSGSGASLLDRLSMSMDDGVHVNSPSLRDRVQLPSKRDREEMLAGDFPLIVEGDDYDGSKRMRKRGAPRGRRGRA